MFENFKLLLGVVVVSFDEDFSGALSCGESRSRFKFTSEG